MARKRIITSKLLPKFLHKMYVKSHCVNMTQKMILNYGSIIPFRVLPNEPTRREEIFVLLREKQYIPNHELKLFIK